MTFTLSRTTRLLIEPGRDSDQNEGPGNNHAGWPTPIGLSAWYEVDVEVEAAPDPETGYIIGIDVIDTTQRYLQQQQVYESALSVTSRIMGTSLFNYI